MKMSIRVKLMGGFFLVGVLLLAVFGVTYIGMSRMGGAAGTLLEESTRAHLVMKTKALISDEWQWYTDYALTHEGAALAEARARGQEINTTLQELRSLLSVEEASESGKFLATHDKFVKDIETMAAVYAIGDQVGGNARMEEVDAQGKVLLSQLHDLEESAITAREKAATATDSAQSSSILIVVVMGIIAATVDAGGALYLAQSISGGINAIAKGLDSIAAGDVTQEVTIKSSDEIGHMVQSYEEMRAYLQEMAQVAGRIAEGDLRVEVRPRSEKDVLGNAFAQMVASLRKMIGQLNQAADSLASASKQLNQAAQEAGKAVGEIAASSQQVAKGADDQSRNIQSVGQGVEQLSQAAQQVAEGAQEQSALIQKTSDIVSQVSTSIGQVATSAQKTTQRAQEAEELSQQGAERARKTIAAMALVKTATETVSKSINEMNTLAAEIGKIVAVIDDIASQTNLLALNATIEAARAGEHGKGFAVVAEEVRKLAERVAVSTKEIEGTVEKIQKVATESVKAMQTSAQDVDSGMRVAEEAGKALEEILLVAKDVGQEVEQIFAAAEEVNTSGSEMVKAIEGVSNVVEANMASAEQASASSSEVNRSVEAVAGVSEENSAASQQVSASAEEVSAHMQQVVASAESLAKTSESLRELVGAFRS